MKKCDSNRYIDGHKLLSKGETFQFVIGRRSFGRTYAMILEAVREGRINMKILYELKPNNSEKGMYDLYINGTYITCDYITQLIKGFEQYLVEYYLINKIKG